MTRRIIVVYNSRDAAMVDPQAKLLRTQLAEVEAELRSPGIRGRVLDRLTVERKLLRSRLGQKDGVGSIEEQAYGEGWHSESNTNPYTDPIHKAAWEKGRAAKRQKFKMNSNARAGEVRGKRFESKKERVGADATVPSWITEGLVRASKEVTRCQNEVIYGNAKRWGPKLAAAKAELASFQREAQKYQSRDYKSEKGFVAKLIDAQTGATLARSEPHISNGLGLKNWIQAEAAKLIKRGKRVKAEVAVVFFDPNMA